MVTSTVSGYRGKVDAVHSLVDHSGPPTVSPCGESDLHKVVWPANSTCRKHWKDRLRMIKQYEVPRRRRRKTLLLLSSNVPGIRLSR
jgi:hypothetical protein